MGFFNFLKGAVKAAGNVAETVTNVVNVVDPILSSIPAVQKGNQSIFDIAKTCSSEFNYLGGSVMANLEEGVQVGLIHFNTYAELTKASLAFQRLKSFALSVNQIAETLEDQEIPEDRLVTAQNQLIWVKATSHVMAEAVSQFQVLFKTKSKDASIIESSTMAFNELIRIADGYAADLSTTLLALGVFVDFVPVNPSNVYNAAALGRSNTWEYVGMAVDISNIQELGTTWDQLFSLTYGGQYAQDVRELRD